MDPILSAMTASAAGKLAEVAVDLAGAIWKKLPDGVNVNLVRYPDAPAQNYFRVINLLPVDIQIRELRLFKPGQAKGRGAKVNALYHISRGLDVYGNKVHYKIRLAEDSFLYDDGFYYVPVQEVKQYRKGNTKFMTYFRYWHPEEKKWMRSPEKEVIVVDVVKVVESPASLV